MARKKLPIEQREVCAPASYPRVHDCGRQPWGPHPGACQGDPNSRVHGCEILASPAADPPGSVWWVGEERELWRRGEDFGIYNARGECLPWKQVLTEMVARGARLQLLAPAHPRWGKARVRAHIGAPLVLVSDLPEQLELLPRIPAGAEHGTRRR